MKRRENMALTRAFLKGMGLTDEQVGAIIEEHTSVTSALKDQIKGYKEKADEYDDVKKERIYRRYPIYFAYGKLFLPYGICCSGG